jgi:hypothetical protein
MPVLAENQHGAMFFSPAKSLEPLDRHLRTPVLKFLLDWSLRAADYDSAQLIEIVEATAREWPTAHSFEITAIGLDSATLARGAISDAARLIEEGLDKLRLPRQGGFDADRAVRWALVSHALSTNAASASTFPLITVITRRDTFVEMPGDLSAFSPLNPDIEGYRLVTLNAGALQRMSWRGELLDRLNQREVFVFYYGGRFAAAAPDDNAPLMAIFVNSADSPQPVEYLTRHHQFLPIPDARFISPEEPLAVASGVWLKDLERKLFPDRNKGTLPELVAAARESGVLTPSASYVVFETAAQWEMARRMEKKKLGDHEALPIAAVPEPSTYLLLGAGVLFIIFQRNRARLKVCIQSLTSASHDQAA